MKKVIFSILFVLIVQEIAMAQVTDVDLNTLIREIDNNQARANQLYHNRTIRTTGIIHGIDNDSVWLGRGSGTEYMLDLLVVFNSSEKAKLINLNKGQRLTIRGVYDGTAPMVVIRRAVIDTAPQPAAAPKPAPTPEPIPVPTPAPTSQPAVTPQSDPVPTQESAPSDYITLMIRWVPGTGLINNGLAKNEKMRVYADTKLVATLGWKQPGIYWIPRDTSQIWVAIDGYSFGSFSPLSVKPEEIYVTFVATPCVKDIFNKYIDLFLVDRGKNP